MFSSAAWPPTLVTVLPVKPREATSGWAWSSWPSAGCTSTACGSTVSSSGSATSTFQLISSPKSKNAPSGGVASSTTGRVLPTVIGLAVTVEVPREGDLLVLGVARPATVEGHRQRRLARVGGGVDAGDRRAGPADVVDAVEARRRVVTAVAASPVQDVHRAVGAELGVDRGQERHVGQERVDLLHLRALGGGGVLQLDVVHLVARPVVEERLAVVRLRELGVGRQVLVEAVDGTAHGGQAATLRDGADRRPAVAVVHVSGTGRGQVGQAGVAHRVVDRVGAVEVVTDDRRVQRRGAAVVDVAERLAVGVLALVVAAHAQRPAVVARALDEVPLGDAGGTARGGGVGAVVG